MNKINLRNYCVVKNDNHEVYPEGVVYVTMYLYLTDPYSYLIGIPEGEEVKDGVYPLNLLTDMFAGMPEWLNAEINRREEIE